MTTSEWIILFIPWSFTRYKNVSSDFFGQFILKIKLLLALTKRSLRWLLFQHVAMVTYIGEVILRKYYIN